MIVEFSLEEEQLADLTWARDVLAEGKAGENQAAAWNMLKSLAARGCTVGIRRAADAAAFAHSERAQ